MTRKADVFVCLFRSTGRLKIVQRRFLKDGLLVGVSVSVRWYFWMINCFELLWVIFDGKFARLVLKWMVPSNEVTSVSKGHLTELNSELL